MFMHVPRLPRACARLRARLPSYRVARHRFYFVVKGGEAEALGWLGGLSACAVIAPERCGNVERCRWGGGLEEDTGLLWPCRARVR